MLGLNKAPKTHLRVKHSIALYSNRIIMEIIMELFLYVFLQISLAAVLYFPSPSPRGSWQHVTNLLSHWSIENKTPHLTVQL